jgi:hypothetical protein
VFGEAHLRRILKAYASYYNDVRTHLSLDKDAPEFRHSETGAASPRFHSWAGCIITRFGFRFSAGTAFNVARIAQISR